MSSTVLSPSSDGTRFCNEKGLGSNDFSTLEVVPQSNLEYYPRASQMRGSFYRNWFNFWQDENEAGQTATASLPSSEPPASVLVPVKDAETPAKPPTPIITICGMPQRAFLIVFGVIAGLLALVAILGGVAGVAQNKGSPKTVTDIVTVTATPTIANSATATTSAECAGGTGYGNLSGLCSFACSYGYCPAGACTCTATGTPAATPTVVGIDGVPVAGESDEYEGLCSFCCNHGYCPSAACTTANGTSTTSTSSSTTFSTSVSSAISSLLGTTADVTTTSSSATRGTIAGISTATPT